MLTVGFPLVPGYGTLGADGQPQGYAVELMSALAERAGLEVTFKPLAAEDEYLPHWQTDTDITLFLEDSPERRETMDFTIPVEGMAVSLVVRNDDGTGIAALGDLAGRRVGVKGNSTL